MPGGVWDSCMSCSKILKNNRAQKAPNNFEKYL